MATVVEHRYTDKRRKVRRRLAKLLKDRRGDPDPSLRGRLWTIIYWVCALPICYTALHLLREHEWDWEPFMAGLFMGLFMGYSMGLVEDHEYQRRSKLIETLRAREQSLAQLLAWER